MKTLRLFAGLLLSLPILARGAAIRAAPSPLGRRSDAALANMLADLLGSAELGPGGDVVLRADPPDRRFLEPYSGLYFQFSAEGREAFASRSLWDLRLSVNRSATISTTSFRSARQCDAALRIAERDVRLPNSPVRWRVQVAVQC